MMLQQQQPDRVIWKREYDYRLHTGWSMHFAVLPCRGRQSEENLALPLLIAFLPLNGTGKSTIPYKIYGYRMQLRRINITSSEICSFIEKFN